MPTSAPEIRTGIRPAIVHVSGDYPDAVNPAKTPVVRSLTQLVADRFDQHVLSLNRRPVGRRALTRPLDPLRGRLRVETVTQGPVESLRYRAPGRGILHATMLDQLGDWIAQRLRHAGVPSLIVGHKLTIEGIAVARAARILGIPYALSIQGNTDVRILRMRPDLRSRLADIYHGAAVVFPFAPWAQAAVERRLGKRSGPVVPLPCPTEADAVVAPEVTGGGVVSAFHLNNWRGKNLRRLIAATMRAAHEESGLALTIVGGGSGRDVARVRALAGRSPHVALEGAVPHVRMATRLHMAAGFAMPSLAESFGLVFTEALLAGTPILYPAGTAVDGWFDDCPFAIRVDPRDVDAIAAGMLRLVREETALKRALADWHSAGAAERFRRPAIARAFGDGLAIAMGR